MLLCTCSFDFFFFNATATTAIYTLSLHDALPILMLTRSAVPGVTVARSRTRSPCPTTTLAMSSAECASVALTMRRSEEHTSELQSHSDLVCRLLLEKKKRKQRLPAVTDKLPKYNI